MFCYFILSAFRKQSEAVRKNEESKAPHKRSKAWTIANYWRQSLLSQFFWLYFAVWLISLNETSDNAPYMTTLAIIFEVVSAYGTVGYSFGLPSTSISLSGGMRSSSKMAVAFTMLLGRNRGLPVHVYPEDMRLEVKQEVNMRDVSYEYEGN